MKVTIVIPVYNAEYFLDTCIQSAINQTYNDTEIIAVDDGSNDKSLEILQSYSDKIKVIHKENGGTPTALNMGIKNMTGDWFKWLSADDLLKENAIEKLVHEASLTKNKEFCIFYSHYDLIDSSGNIVGEFTEPNYNEISLFDRNVILLDHFYGNGTTSLIHKSMFDKFGMFDENIGFQEDYEFWLRCCILHNCRLHLVPENTAQYRIHEGQLTKTKVDESLSHADYVRTFVLEKLPQDKRLQYENALKQYKKQKPLKVRIRRGIRDAMFSVLPKGASDKLLQMYMERKKTY